MSTRKFFIAVNVGAGLSDPRNEVQVPDDWCGTEECGDLAYAVYQCICERPLAHCDITGQLSQPGATVIKKVAIKTLQDILSGADLPCRPNHGEYDEFARGFLAGQIFGKPAYKTAYVVEKAERIWTEDSKKQNPEYGYYQEVLNEVKETYKELI